MSFIYYTGKCIQNDDDDEFVFEMKNPAKNLKFNSYIEIADPTVDNSFKKLFLKNEDLTISLLNDLLFSGRERITKIQFMPNEEPGMGRFGSGSIRMDIVCKCKLTKTLNKDDDHFKNETDLIIDLEMQKFFKSDNDERFIKYLRALAGKYMKTKILILVLTITPNTYDAYQYKGSEIYLQKKFLNKKSDEYKNVYNFEHLLIYQIDLNYLNKNLFDDKNKEKKFYILENNFFSISSKEWIKFLTISLWGNSFSDGYFLLPPTNKEFFNNENVYKAIDILRNKTLPYQNSMINENCFVQDLDEIEKIKKEIVDLNQKYEKLKNLLKEQKNENDSDDEFKPKYHANKRSRSKSKRSKSKPKEKPKKKNK